MSKTKPETKGLLLIIDDEADALYSFKRFLADEPYEILTADNGRDGVRIFSERQPDLVLMDVRMPGMDGMEAMREIRRVNPRALVIMMTAFSTTRMAIEAIKAGALDYVLKPFDVEKIKRLIADAMRSARSMKSVVSYQPLLSKEDYAQGIIGKSEAMQAVYKEIGRVAGKNITVLITGETGTGKELVARAIYHHSERSKRKFLAVNCGAIPEALLESELFGHERGAFTGAVARKIGKFEISDSGTLFLDEIAELSAATQSKLLRVVQENEIDRVGGSAPIAVDVRLIAATNRDLGAMIRDGSFREDLFYRLNVASIHMPPLRERIEDIGLLVEYFVTRFEEEYGCKVTVSKEAIKKLEGHRWPGNVRELENTIRNSFVRVKGEVLLPEDIKLGAAENDTVPRAGPAGDVRGDGDTATGEADDLDSLMCRVFDRVREMRESGEAEDAFDLVEHYLVREALVHTSGNQVKAARLLGITRSTLRKRMEKYGLKLKTKVESKGKD